MSVWTGRVDAEEGPQALRWHQCIAPWKPDAPPGIVLLGFCCDEGVRRNQGRVGAAQGPQAIRKALANFAWHQEYPAYDAGDITCTDGNLEAAQDQLAEAVATVLRAGHRPLILGGGHETAWGTFQGLTRFAPDATIGIMNVDAHFDLRADRQATSGTPFAQMADWCAALGRPFDYFCWGIAKAANTAALFARAEQLKVLWLEDADLRPWELEDIETYVWDFSGPSDLLYLSIDLDVLPGSVMPAVSAPAARGVPLEAVELVMDAALQSAKLAVVDVVEFNPTFDMEHRAARVAAGLVWHLARGWHAYRE